MKRIFPFIIFLMVMVPALGQKPSFSFVPEPDLKEIRLMYGNRMLTSLCYYDSSMKPILFPVNTVDGITVTRGYPFQPRAGERTDHPHHTGIWLNYESVNGLDFWNNSTAIDPARRHLYGTIRLIKIERQEAKGNRARLETTSGWYRPDGFELLRETTLYSFQVKDGRFIIDQQTTLKANDSAVLFKDVKDGLFAIRVARELEMPSTQKDVFVDAYGNKTDVPKMDNTGVTGLYESSRALKGDSVWGKRAEWVKLTGEKDGKPITIAIIDHPSNAGYPAYWHARGYGLFAVNPLGQKVFSNGKEELNLQLRPGQQVRFRYRLIVATEHLDTTEMKKLADSFTTQSK